MALYTRAGRDNRVFASLSARLLLHLPCGSDPTSGNPRLRGYIGSLRLAKLVPLVALNWWPQPLHFQS